MNLIEKVEAIETPTFKNPDWFYHRFLYDDETFTDMLTCGLKCRHSLRMRGFTYNGPYYISLYKDLGPFVEQYHSAYDLFCASYPNFIIDNITPIKCRHDRDYSIFRNTIIPLRNSGLHDEYQQFYRITPDKFIGLQCSILKWYQNGQIENLKVLRNIISKIQSLEITLPIYDFSRCSETGAHLVQAPEYLKICDSIIEDLSAKQHILKKK